MNFKIIDTHKGDVLIFRDFEIGDDVNSGDAHTVKIHTWVDGAQYDTRTEFPDPQAAEQYVADYSEASALRFITAAKSNYGVEDND